MVARTLDDLAAAEWRVARDRLARHQRRPASPSPRGIGSSEILERENYRPNLAARRLASGRSGVVGVVMHLRPHLLFQDPYFSQLLQGITDVLAEREPG